MVIQELLLEEEAKIDHTTETLLKSIKTLATIFL